MNNEKREYTSLKKLVGDEFTVRAVKGYQWKKYDADSNRMIVAEKYEQGFSKKYGIETDKGFMDISAGQLGNMLEGAQKNGIADLRDKTFSVKSNGKEGMDIRYWINLVYNSSQSQTPATEPQEASQDIPRGDSKPVDDGEIDLADIPF